jgi:hypothetical protein
MTRRNFDFSENFNRRFYLFLLLSLSNAAKDKQVACKIAHLHATPNFQKWVP